MMHSGTGRTACELSVNTAIPTMPVFSDFNTRINTAQICGGIPVFGILVLEALMPLKSVVFFSFHIAQGPVVTC